LYPKELHKKGKDLSTLRRKKEEMLEEIYRMLVMFLGKPPSIFDWEYRDKDKNFNRIKNITPQEFLKKYVPVDIENIVTLINAPMSDKEYRKLYTVKYLGSIKGKRVIYLNLEIQRLKKFASKTIKNGNPVWFGSDVGKMYHRDKGILDSHLYDYGSLFNTKFNLNKGQRLDYGESRLTHAMVLSGVDIKDNKTVKWKVENSWGKDPGDKGYFIMSDEWFDEYVYEVAINKKYFDNELLNVLTTEPEVLPPWDPMGAVARVF